LRGARGALSPKKCLWGQKYNFAPPKIIVIITTGTAEWEVNFFALPRFLSNYATDNHSIVVSWLVVDLRYFDRGGHINCIILILINNTYILSFLNNNDYNN